MTSNTNSLLNSALWSPDDHTLTFESQSRFQRDDPSHAARQSMEDDTTGTGDHLPFPALLSSQLAVHPKRAQEPLSPDHKTPSHPPGMPPETSAPGKNTGRASLDSANFDPDDARNSEPSPDVNLDFPSMEDVTAGDGRRQGLLGEYPHPLAAAEASPGRVYIPPQSGNGSVRSRGRVPDPLEVLPFGEHTPVNEFGERQLGNTG